MYIEDIKCNIDFFEIVDEPDYSFHILKDYQQKFNINTCELYIYYKLIPDIQDKIDPDILNNWMFNYDVYLKAGGDPNKLIEDFNLNRVDSNQIEGQAKNEKEGSNDTSLLN